MHGDQNHGGRHGQHRTRPKAIHSAAQQRRSHSRDGERNHHERVGRVHCILLALTFPLAARTARSTTYKLLRQQRGGDVVPGQHRAVDGDAGSGEEPEGGGELGHIAEVNLFLIRHVVVHVFDELPVRTAWADSQQPLLVVFPDLAVGRLVDGHNHEGGEQAQRADASSKPQSEGDVLPLRQRRRGAVVDGRSHTRNAQIHAKRQGQLLAVEPLCNDGTLTDTKRLSAEAKDDAPDQHDRNRPHAGAQSEHNLAE
mmetsp:Transcript_7786/g.24439  ORF Transcript_7786/g.24439 Transcript_7786/m.24439 type:complete len:255 (-) Transcript_7786:316-1080(-)